ncbi:MAG TPA: hypothetical protein VN922_05710 [Bacteroidia bacterium]|nr:hypothetical protein [Bacteroidia bacterium]
MKNHNKAKEQLPYRASDCCGDIYKTMVVQRGFTEKGWNGRKEAIMVAETTCYKCGQPCGIKEYQPKIK